MTGYLLTIKLPEILPLRVLFFYQLFFPLASPVLELFFPADGVVHIFEEFVVDPFIQVVLLSKARDGLASVLVDALQQV